MDGLAVSTEAQERDKCEKHNMHEIQNRLCGIWSRLDAKMKTGSHYNGGVMRAHFAVSMLICCASSIVNDAGAQALRRYIDCDHLEPDKPAPQIIMNGRLVNPCQSDIRKVLAAAGSGAILTAGHTFLKYADGATFEDVQKTAGLYLPETAINKASPLAYRAVKSPIARRITYGGMGTSAVIMAGLAIDEFVIPYLRDSADTSLENQWSPETRTVPRGPGAKSAARLSVQSSEKPAVAPDKAQEPIPAHK